jgi:hypothetical protein
MKCNEQEKYMLITAAALVPGNLGSEYDCRDKKETDFSIHDCGNSEISWSAWESARNGSRRELACPCPECSAGFCWHTRETMTRPVDLNDTTGPQGQCPRTLQ